MSQRQDKLRLKIRTAEKEIESAAGRLRDALLTGAGSGPVRFEIDDLHRRIEDARVELAEIAASEDRARGKRLSAMSETIAAEAEATLAEKLAALRPPAKTATAELEDHHVSN